MKKQIKKAAFRVWIAALLLAVFPLWLFIVVATAAEGSVFAVRDMIRDGQFDLFQLYSDGWKTLKAGRKLGSVSK